MSDFTTLEQAVLTAIVDALTGIGAPLAALLATAKVSGRDNTGHGFYTAFEVDRRGPPLDWPQRMINGPNAEVQIGDETLFMGFILWLDGGYPGNLEGFQYFTPSGEAIDLKSTDLAAAAWLRPLN